MKKLSLCIVIILVIMASLVVWYRAEKTVIVLPTLDTVVVGINTEFPPFAFKHDDQPTGFDIDVIKEVFSRLKKEITFKDLPFDALIPEIQLGNIQVIGAGMTPTKERAQRALFTKPHITSDYLVIISLKNNTPLTTLDELAGKTVVVNEGYTADYYMSAQPYINLLRLSSALASDGILALDSGKADAFVTALNPMQPYFEKYGTDAFSITPIPGAQESSAFAISKHYSELRDDIQEVLNAMQADGTLDALKRKWKLS